MWNNGINLVLEGDMPSNDLQLNIEEALKNWGSGPYMTFLRPSADIIVSQAKIKEGDFVLDVGAGFGEEDRYPVSASFYTNSFLHTRGGIFDLTQLATRFDTDGGGHANACGCRIQPLENGERVERTVVVEDIDNNVREWLKIWAMR